MQYESEGFMTDVLESLYDAGLDAMAAIYKNRNTDYEIPELEEIIALKREVYRELCSEDTEYSTAGNYMRVLNDKELTYREMLDIIQMPFGAILLEKDTLLVRSEMTGDLVLYIQLRPLKVPNMVFDRPKFRNIDEIPTILTERPEFRVQFNHYLKQFRFLDNRAPKLMAAAEVQHRNATYLGMNIELIGNYKDRYAAFFSFIDQQYKQP